MTMTLESVAYGLEEEALSHTGSAARRLMDAAKQIRELASQPQPVAQVEAVDETLYRKVRAIEYYEYEEKVMVEGEYGLYEATEARYWHPCGKNAGAEPPSGWISIRYVDRYEAIESAAPAIPTGHRVVPVELGGGLRAEDPIESHWRPLLEWAMGSIDELNEGPMTFDQWGEDAGLYDQARAMLAAAPDAGGV